MKLNLLFTLVLAPLLFSPLALASERSDNGHCSASAIAAQVPKALRRDMPYEIDERKIWIIAMRPEDATKAKFQPVVVEFVTSGPLGQSGIHWVVQYELDPSTCVITMYNAARMIPLASSRVSSAEL